jgi:rod shape determining protein RodA
LWLNLGILIQPSEIAKLVTIITLAHYLAVNYPKLSTLWGLIQSLFHMLPPILLVFFQPDLGATIVFVVIWIIMVWGAGLRLQHIALGVFIGIAGFPVLWTFMEPYQRDRITTYAQCSILGACAADDEDYYNIRQALISIGNGGLSGRGYANGTQGQLRFLRVRHTDFIFSQIAEEFGFIGSVVVMGLFWVILERILRGAREAADAFGSLICYGVAGMIFFQIFVSIGMNLSLIPVTGLTLPLVSSGGTSLLSIMAAIGLAESVIMRRRRIKGSGAAAAAAAAGGGGGVLWGVGGAGVPGAAAGGRWDRRRRRHVLRVPQGVLPHCRVVELPSELIDQIVTWERQQTEAEGEWRLKQSRMHLEFEERKRRLQEQQLGQRKKLRESCDAALRPTYETGTSV